MKKFTMPYINNVKELEQFQKRMNKLLDELIQEAGCEYKAGDWVRTKYFVFKIDTVLQDVVYPKGFVYNIKENTLLKWAKGYYICNVERVQREANDLEIETALRAEAIRRGIKEGVTVKYPNTNNEMTVGVIRFNPKYKQLCHGDVGYWLEKNAEEWVTVVEKEIKFFGHVVKKDGKYIKVDCKEYTIAEVLLFKDILSDMINNNLEASTISHTHTNLVEALDKLQIKY